MPRRILLAALAAALLSWPTGGWAGDALHLRLDFGGYGPRHAFFSAKRMIGGGRVVDTAGNDVGKVRDLLVEADGRIDSLVIDGGGVLGIGRALFPYPWAKAMIARPDLVKLPFDTGRIASFRDRFGDLRRQAAPQGTHRLRDVLSRDVYIHGGKVRFGRIADALLSVDGRVVGLAIDPMPGVAATTALYAMPFRLDPAAGYRLEGRRYILPHGVNEIARLDRYRAALNESERPPSD